MKCINLAPLENTNDFIHREIFPNGPKIDLFHRWICHFLGLVHFKFLAQVTGLRKQHKGAKADPPTQGNNKKRPAHTRKQHKDAWYYEALCFQRAC